MTIAESLTTYNPYPISVGRREMICIECGLTSEQEVTEEAIKSAPYKRAVAKVYKYLASAPNVIENGISFNFSDADRKRFLSLASALLDEIGDNSSKGNGYGYVGEDL